MNAYSNQSYFKQYSDALKHPMFVSAPTPEHTVNRDRPLDRLREDWAERLSRIAAHLESKRGSSVEDSIADLFDLRADILIDLH